MDFKERIKILREASGLNQKDFAASLGIDATTYNKWEKTKSVPSIDTLVRLARHFGITVDYLLGVEERVGGIETFYCETIDLLDAKVKRLEKTIKDIENVLKD